MLAGDAQAGFGAVVAEHRVVVAEHDRGLLGQVGFGQRFAGAKIVGDVGREPRTAVAAAADHHAVSAGAVERGLGVVQGDDVAVNDDRDADSVLLRGG